MRGTCLDEENICCTPLDLKTHRPLSLLPLPTSPHSCTPPHLHQTRRTVVALEARRLGPPQTPPTGNRHQVVHQPVVHSRPSGAKAAASKMASASTIASCPCLYFHNPPGVRLGPQASHSKCLLPTHVMTAPINGGEEKLLQTINISLTAARCRRIREAAKH